MTQQHDQSEKDRTASRRQKLLRFINGNHDCQSLLYDLNLMPETTLGSIEEWKMFRIADAIACVSNAAQAMEELKQVPGCFVRDGTMWLGKPTRSTDRPAYYLPDAPKETTK